MRDRRAWLFAAVIAASGAVAERVSVSEQGDLVWSDTGRPACLVSTTSKWQNYRTFKWQQARMGKAAARFPEHAWIYGAENSVAKMRRMGFNAMNPFALPTGFLPLLPGYRPGLTPEEDFAQLERLAVAFGWHVGHRLDVLGNPHTPAEWEPVLRELRALADMPFYLDLSADRVLDRPETFSPVAPADRFPLSAADIRRGALRYEVRHVPSKLGSLPAFGHVSARVSGRSAAGEACRTDAHSRTGVARHHVMGARRSVVTSDEWAEVEIPLSLLATGQDSYGRIVPIVSLERLSLGAGPGIRYRNVRMEY